jgi:hypothetical protein
MVPYLLGALEKALPAPVDVVNASDPKNLEEHGLRLLCGKWNSDQEDEKALGYDLAGAAWVAVQP